MKKKSSDNNQNDIIFLAISALIINSILIYFFFFRDLSWWKLGYVFFASYLLIFCLAVIAFDKTRDIIRNKKSSAKRKEGWQ